MSQHDLLHIQGKPYMLVPLHEYRQMTAAGAPESGLPPDLIDTLYARQSHPVKILRAHRGLTQDELAKASGLSRPYLTEIETGKKEGSITAIKAIAAALDVPAGLLL
jgi:DNA-binding XRE family transcriptional regulator